MGVRGRADSFSANQIRFLRQVSHKSSDFQRQMHARRIGGELSALPMLTRRGEFTRGWIIRHTSQIVLVQQVNKDLHKSLGLNDLQNCETTCRWHGSCSCLRRSTQVLVWLDAAGV